MSKFNAALCRFSLRWELDGDYLRCRDCNRPQLASYARMDFPHGPDCQSGDVEAHPWLTLLQLITSATGADHAD